MKRLPACALLLLLGSNPAGAVDERDPVTIISQVSTQIIEVLNSRRAEFTENPELLTTVVRETLLPLIDVVYSARLVLGRAGRDVSPEQLSAFAKALSNILINRYADSLIGLDSDGLIQVMPMKGKNTDKLTRVRTRIKLTRGGFIPVDFAFHKTGKAWKVFDVTVEGISYVITFRNQISPRVQANGIDKVTADIIAGSVRFHE
ncbi:MAG: ABC transporter substrate-binding protein [Xanthomonadales bacterium]